MYHFPNDRLLRNALTTVNDWVIFYEGRRGLGRGYYAVQRVEKIVPDPVDSSHSFAILDRGSLLDFETLVPRLKENGQPYETGLPIMGGSNTTSIRPISDADFAAIVTAGMREVAGPDALPRSTDSIAPAPAQPGFAEPATPFVPPGNGPLRERVIMSRAFREASFARQVKRAYGARCALSCLELRNGGGRAEVEAAHIVPVEQRGPDSVSNGLALSGTLHWMFDRGLIGVGEDNSILVAGDSVAKDIAERLLTPDRQLILPREAHLRPHPAYLEWHRKQVFKG